MLEELEGAKIGVKIDDKWCGALLYADDVLLAGTGVELQDMLDVVRWKMKFDGKKSKVIAVGKSGKILKWNIDGEVRSSGSI